MLVSKCHVSVGKSPAGEAAEKAAFRFPVWPDEPQSDDVTTMLGVRWRWKLCASRVNSLCFGPGLSSLLRCELKIAILGGYYARKKKTETTNWKSYRVLCSSPSDKSYNCESSEDA